MKNTGAALLLLGIVLPLSFAQAAVTIPLTVNLSEAAIVTGTPQIVVDVGGVSRYATYTSGSGSNTLTFTLSPQAGDVDLDGITVSTPIQLNGGTIRDAAGNDASLTFTPPNTSSIKIDYPSLSMDFVYDADGRYTLNGTAYNDLNSFLSAAGGSFTRSSTATYFDSTGTLQAASTNQPRFDSDPHTHILRGILIEESRTNLLKYSDQFEDATWAKHQSSITANAATAPDGTLSADKLIGSNGTTTEHSMKQSISYTSGNAYTFTVFAKSAEYSNLRIWISTSVLTGGGAVNYDLAAGSITASGGTITSKITAVGNSWYRCQIAFTATATTTGAWIFTDLGNLTGDGTSGLYIWGAQLEQGTFATSYIPTTAATVTRAADTLSVPTGTWLNSAAGSLFAEAMAYNAITALSSGGSPTVVSINSTTSTNIARIGRYTSNSGFFQSSAAGITNLALGTWASGASEKIAGSYGPDGFSNIMGTNPVYTQGASPITGSFNQMRIGQFIGSGYWSSSISKIKYYPARVTDTQLQLLTQ